MPNEQTVFYEFVWQRGWACFYQYLNFFQINFIFNIFRCLLMLKIFFLKNKKYYFDIFLNKNNFKNNYHYI